VENPFPALAKSISHDAAENRKRSLLTGSTLLDFFVGVVGGIIGYYAQIGIVFAALFSNHLEESRGLWIALSAATSLAVLAECIVLGRRYVVVGRASFYTVFVLSALIVSTVVIIGPYIR
jgi:hypothetical protein